MEICDADCTVREAPSAMGLSAKRLKMGLRAKRLKMSLR